MCLLRTEGLEAFADEGRLCITDDRVCGKEGGRGDVRERRATELAGEHNVRLSRGRSLGHLDFGCSGRSGDYTDNADGDKVASLGLVKGATAGWCVGMLCRFAEFGLWLVDKGRGVLRVAYVALCKVGLEDHVGSSGMARGIGRGS